MQDAGENEYPSSEQQTNMKWFCDLSLVDLRSMAMCARGCVWGSGCVTAPCKRCIRIGTSPQCNQQENKLWLLKITNVGSSHYKRWETSIISRLHMQPLESVPTSSDVPPRAEIFGIDAPGAPRGPSRGRQYRPPARPRR